MIIIQIYYICYGLKHYENVTIHCRRLSVILIISVMVLHRFFNNIIIKLAIKLCRKCKFKLGNLNNIKHSHQTSSNNNLCTTLISVELYFRINLIHYLKKFPRLNLNFV